MAFVFKSERDFSYSKLDNPGPGHYLQTENDYSKIKEKKSPFMSTSKKEALNSKINPSNLTPGPGAYFKDIVLSKDNEKENILNKNSKNAIYKILDYDEIAKNSKFAKLMQEKLKPVGFLSKDKRFNDKSNLNNNPGPGFYNKTDQNFFLESTKKIETINNLRQNFNKTESNFNIRENRTTSNFYEGPVSIPSKSKIWGYIENKEGEIINNKKDIISEISPCTYDIYGITNNKWTKNNGLTSIWSKSKSRKTNRDKKNSPKKEFILTETNFGSRPSTNDNTNINTNINFYKSDQNFHTDVSCFSKTGDKSVFGNKFVIKKQVETYLKKQKEKSERKNKIITVSDLVENKNTPGPGYYFPKIIDEIVTTEESKQNFGSREPRFKTLEIEDQSYLGPGCYFKSNEMSMTKKRIKAGRSINKLNRKRVYSSYDLIKKSNSQNPGPGNYELIRNWTTNLNKNSKAIFGTTENRFVKPKTTNLTEGPGSYLPINDNHRKFKEIIDPITKKTIYEKSNEDYLRLNPKRYLQKNKISNTTKIKKNIEEFPCVGDYNPDIIFNIDYKLHKNVTKFTTKIAPFNSLNRRFEKVKLNKETLNIGPGIHYKEKKVETSKKKMYPFTSSSKRENLFINDANKVGPGDYNINSWFDWNKKTFNIGYI